MTSIEKISKHNIFFTSRKLEVYSDLLYTRIIYTSNIIYDPVSLNITNSIDLVEKLTPFLYYLSSEYLERTDDNYFTFGVEVFSPDELVSTRVSSFGRNDFTTEYEGSLIINKTRIKYDDVNECYYRVFTKPFQIHIIVADHIDLNELEEEDEEYNRYTIQEEEKEQITSIKSFKTVECVVCLVNLPNILFCYCWHICVCLEYEEIKPLNICPICKTRNFIKRII